MSNLAIRSVTTGIPVDQVTDSGLAEVFSRYTQCFTEQFQKENFSVRTQRICLSPINHHVGWSAEGCISIIEAAQGLATKANIRWICVPFDFTDSTVSPQHANIPLQVIKKYKNCFVNMLVAKDNSINISGVKAASSLIKQVSKLSINGFDNFRVGVACNIDSHTPFFPFSYCGKKIGFSFAVETLVTAIQVAKSFHGEVDLSLFREAFIEVAVTDLKKISQIAAIIEKDIGFEFKGVDISFAPFPNEASIIELMELLGLDQLGGKGTVFLTSILTDLLREVLDAAQIKKVGFNGVMYSLLEDDGLAKRNNQRMFDMDSLQLYSTVCACGIDMVPLPGSILEEELTGIILDTAALSVNLKKPLGVRILPIPNMDVNEYTDFNYDFLINTRIKEVKNAGFNTDNISNLLLYKQPRSQ